MGEHRILTRPISWYARIKFIETLLSEVPEAREDFETTLKPFRAQVDVGAFEEAIGETIDRVIEGMKVMYSSGEAVGKWAKKWGLVEIEVDWYLSLTTAAWGPLTMGRHELEFLPGKGPIPELAPSPPPHIPSFDPTLEPYKKWLEKVEALIRQHGQDEQKRYLEHGYVWVKGARQDEQAVRLKNVPDHHFRWAVLKWCGGFTLEQIKDIDERREIGSSAETSTMSEAITGVLKLIKAHL